MLIRWWLYRLAIEVAPVVAVYASDLAVGVLEGCGDRHLFGVEWVRVPVGRFEGELEFLVAGHRGGVGPDALWPWEGEARI